MSAATVAAIAKAAVAVLSNEKTRKALGWVIVAILSPLIVLVVLICAVLSGSSQHNVSAGRTMNLIPSRNVMNTEKFPMVAEGTRLAT